MTIEKAFFSYNTFEWWNAHLASALARRVAVVECPMARFNQAGHPPETDIGRLVNVDRPEDSIYLGSLDQMFRGIAGLPMRTAIWTDYFPSINRQFLSSLRLFDVVFCSQKDSVADLMRRGVDHAEWLPFAFDTTFVTQPDVQKLYDVAFVGSLDLPPTRAERLDVLERLGQRYRLNDYRTPVFGDDMMRVYNRARMVVNIPAAGGLNMRTFEALASGALLLTKPVGNGQADLFKDGTHLVTYRDGNDLIDKIDYYLRHEDERRAIADAGMREVLAHHTYDHRAARVLDVMTHARTGRSRDRAAHAAAYADYYSYLRRPDLMTREAFARGVAPLTRVRLLVRAGAKFGRSVVDRTTRWARAS